MLWISINRPGIKAKPKQRLLSLQMRYSPALCIVPGFAEGVLRPSNCRVREKSENSGLTDKHPAKFLLFVAGVPCFSWESGNSSGDSSQYSATNRAGLFKARLANPGLARILIAVLQLFGEVFCLYCLAF